MIISWVNLGLEIKFPKMLKKRLLHLCVKGVEDLRSRRFHGKYEWYKRILTGPVQTDSDSSVQSKFWTGLPVQVHGLDS